MRIVVFAALVTAGVLVLAGSAAAEPVPGFAELVSQSSSSVQGDQDSELPAISADGRYVAFVSFAVNLVPDDTNEAADVFVRDRVLGTPSASASRPAAASRTGTAGS